MAVEERSRAPLSRWTMLACVVVVMASLAHAAAQLDRAHSPHRRDGDCKTCHTEGLLALSFDKAGAARALRADLAAVCASCHPPQGPSHKTGVKPKRPVPAVLPLGAQGTVECWTCHFSHGENPHSENYLRTDNRRGGLCLQCHTLEELQ